MRKVRKSGVRKVLPKTQEVNNEVDSLREFSLEADAVLLLKKQPGFEFLERDITQYKDEISAKLAYLDPKSREFSEARILFIAGDKLLSLFSDYAENRKRALELLERIDNPSENIVLDVDN
jgi:adenine-specific DNA methylase